MIDAAALLARLEARIRSYGHPRTLVAFSGGVDSSTVLAVAARALGPGAVQAVTAVSPSLPTGELEAARALAEGLGVAHRTVETHEVEREAYARNDAQRCYHCKTELYGTLRALTRETRPGTAILAGANADDVNDLRPGLRAAEQQGIANPLLEEGLGKAETRAVARHLRLTVADKPALACLSSRVAPGIRVTPELLARIDRAEQLVRARGFEMVRVRHLGPAASVEVPADDIPRLHATSGLVDDLQALGWDEVRFDAEGYRQGSLNRLLPLLPTR